MYPIVAQKLKETMHTQINNPLRGFVLDLVFPRRCINCQKFLSNDQIGYVCAPCLATISLTSIYTCAFCESQTINGQTCQFCKKNRCLDRMLIASNYAEPLVEKIIQFMKYKFVKSLSVNIGQIMIDYINNKVAPADISILKNSIILSVPLSKKRFNWRGFNQSDLIAKEIALTLGVLGNYRPDLLHKKSDNKPQVEMKNRDERFKNIKGTFAVGDNRDALKEGSVLLIDDVSTTGATLDSCAYALKNAGASKVVAFVFAKNRKYK